MRIIIILLALISSSCLASEVDGQETWSGKKAAAVGISVAALGTFVAYDIGDNTNESHHNVKVYWGVGIGWFAALLFDGYAHKNGRVVVTTEGQSLALHYNF